jgi:hypothetical protein
MGASHLIRTVPEPGRIRQLLGRVPLTSVHPHPYGPDAPSAPLLTGRPRRTRIRAAIGRMQLRGLTEPAAQPAALQLLDGTIRQGPAIPATILFVS